MLVWFSPFPQEPGLLDQLAAAGIEPHSGPESALPAGSLLLYDPPDVVLQQARLRAAPQPRVEALMAAYQQLAALRGGRRLIASWRLRGVEAAAVLPWLQGSHPCPASPAASPEPDPLTALVTLSLLEQRPELVDLYQDLELQAELAATATDTNYRRRLQQRSRPAALFEHWWQPQGGEGQPREADTALQAEAIDWQAELEEQRQQNEQMRQQSEQARQQSEATRQELQTTRQELQAARQELQAAQQQLQRAYADADLAVQQLAEVQAELETLLFSHQEQREQLTTTQQQLRAAQVELTEVRDLAATRAGCIQRQQQQISETEQALLSVQSEVASSRQEADLALQQMQQVQAELEELLFTNQELRQQETSLRRERDDLARQLHQDCAELELTRSRLQEASTELERYVHLSREQARLLNRQNQLTGKALRLAAEATPQG